MITRKVQVYCIDRESHSITLTEGGALHFHNHPNVRELENYLRLEKLGGPACTCARFLQSWRKKEHQKLPNRMQAMHTERFQSAGIFRLWRQYRYKRLQFLRSCLKDRYILERSVDKLLSSNGVAKIALDAFRGPVAPAKIDLSVCRDKSEYVDRFLSSVVNELNLRGHEVVAAFNVTPSRIIQIHGQNIYVDARFKSNIVMSVQIDSPWGLWSGNVVPSKNGNLAAQETADRVEIFLLRGWSSRLPTYTGKHPKHFDEKIKEYLARHPSELISAGRSVEKLAWECFGQQVPSVSFVVNMKVHPLTEEAAIVATRLLQEIEPKLLALQRASMQRFDKLNIELEETTDDV